MDIFAHNGVDHTSASEAAAHSGSSVVLSVVLVTVAVVLLMTAAAWAAKRYGNQPVTVKEEEGEE